MTMRRFHTLILATSLALILVGSPALLKARPLKKPEDVRRHSLLTHSTRPEAWAEWFAVAGLKAGPVRGAAFEHFFMSIEAAVNGLGLALVPDFFVAEELNSGRLCQRLFLVINQPIIRPRDGMPMRPGHHLTFHPERGTSV